MSGTTYFDGGVATRIAAAPTKTMYFFGANKSRGRYEIQRAVAGSFTIISNNSTGYSDPTGGGQTFKGTSNGSTQEMYVNGTKKMSAVDTNIAGGSKIGLYAYRPMYWDDWEGDDISVTTVNYSANQTSYAFGIIQPGSTNNTTATWVLFTNSSSVSTNMSVRMLAATWEAAAAGWTHSDSAAGANTAAMKAASGNTSTWQTAVFIKYNTPYNEIAQSVAANSNYVSGLSLLAPTEFTNGNSNNNTVRFNFYAATP